MTIIVFRTIKMLYWKELVSLFPHRPVSIFYVEVTLEFRIGYKQMCFAKVLGKYPSCVLQRVGNLQFLQLLQSQRVMNE